jgi:amino acid adenylation domain-containing protein
VAAAPDRVIRLDRLDLDRAATAPQPRVRPGDLAYVIQTSGSTGAPKAVQVSHASLRNVVGWHVRAFDQRPGDRVALLAAPGFDAAVCEIWPAMAAGAHLLVPDDDTRLSARGLRDWLVAERITHSFVPTPLAEPLLALPWPDGGALRVLNVAGDRLHLRPRADLPFRVVNSYGPTEAAVAATSGVVRPDGALPPDIGVPIDGAEALVLDAELRPAETGELHLAGIGLARGYLGRADLTADRFVPHPTRPGARVYRTGDLVRWRPDGALDFLGRVDDQVKVRGQRIEPAEVTAALRQHPEVAAAHVTAVGGALVAYVVPADPRRAPDARSLRRFLADRLPAAMVPSACITLAELPLTARGKVDRRALPDPTSHGLVRAESTVSEVDGPRTDLERRLAAVWGEVLGVARVGVHDDFLALGGHSLLATALSERIRDEFGVAVPLRVLLAAPTVATLAEHLARGAPEHAEDLPAVTPGPGYGPLSVQQEQVLFLNRLAPGSTAYHAQTTLRVRGDLDLDVLERALTEVAARHEVLRTTYHDQDGVVRAIVRPPAPVRVSRHDVSGEPPEQREAACARITAELMRVPFDPAALPLARWGAIRLAPDEHELVLVEHHVVHDGWSFAVLMRELDALYNAFRAGRPSPLPPLPAQYGDYARVQRAALAGSGVFAAQLDRWRNRLVDAPDELPLPLDRPRPVVQTFVGDQFRLELPAALPGRLRALCEREGVTPFMALYAAFAALLHRYTGATDLCVGSAFANRRHRGTADLIGMFVNTVVLRCPVTPDLTFRALLRRARDVVLDAAADQEFPFPRLVDALGVRRDPARNPLFQTMFSFHDSPVREPRFGDAAATALERGNGSAKVDIDVVVIPHAQRYLGDAERGDDRITLLWEYNRDLFDRDTVRRMADHFVRLVEHAFTEPDTPVARLAMTARAELDRALEQGTATPVSPAPLVFDRVLGHARVTPDAVAVQDDTGSLSYRDLVAWAGGVAGALRARGAGPDRVVGVCLPRGADLVVAQLGVLLAGAAFLPLDPDQPARHRAAVLADAGATTLITTDADAPPGVVVVAPTGHPPAELAPVAVTGAHLAYVCYTSGSTGRPKGVLVSHGALANFTSWRCAELGCAPDDRFGLLGAPGFDLSVGEIWTALAAGASLHPADQETRLSPGRLDGWLRRRRITVLDLPSVLADGFLTRPAPPDLRVLITGGDRLHARPSPRARHRVVNEYGPTEGTIAITWSDIDPDAPGLPPIGRPAAGCAVHVLDRELRPTPPGVVGELHLGGAGIARGYLGQPAQTADRFVPDPFGAPGSRLYRTGDLARRRADGVLEFVGRVDEQVKLRGNRVEPAQLTAALRRLPDVADAHATAGLDPGTGRPRLVAYLVPRPGAPAPGLGELRHALAADLPDYLLPDALVVLAALPTTSRGKLDRAALPPPPAAPVSPAEPPASETENRVAEVWRDVLRVPSVGVRDNFFEVGGNSLLLGQVHHRLTMDLLPGLRLVDLFQYPTIRALAQHIDGSHGAAEPLPDRPAVDRARLGARRRRVTEA